MKGEGASGKRGSEAAGRAVERDEYVGKTLIHPCQLSVSLI